MEKKSYQAFCFYHEKSPIHSICSFPGCKHQILCEQCLQNHPIEHKPYFIPFSSFMSQDICMKISHGEDLAFENHKIYKQKMESVDKVIEQMRNSFEESIQDIRTQFQNHFSTIFNASEIEPWDIIKAKYDSLKESFDQEQIISNIHAKPLDQAQEQRQNFVELCLGLNFKIQKLVELKDELQEATIQDDNVLKIYDKVMREQSNRVFQTLRKVKPQKPMVVAEQSIFDSIFGTPAPPKQQVSQPQNNGLVRSFSSGPHIYQPHSKQNFMVIQPISQPPTCIQQSQSNLIHNKCTNVSVSMNEKVESNNEQKMNLQNVSMQNSRNQNSYNQSSYEVNRQVGEERKQNKDVPPKDSSNEQNKSTDLFSSISKFILDI